MTIRDIRALSDVVISWPVSTRPQLIAVMVRFFLPSMLILLRPLLSQIPFKNSIFFGSMSSLNSSICTTAFDTSAIASPSDACVALRRLIDSALIWNGATIARAIWVLPVDGGPNISRIGMVLDSAAHDVRE